MQDLFTQGYYSHKDFEEHQIFGKYPTDWKLSSIGELAESIPGGGTPKKSNDDYWGGDIPWASVKDFNGPRLSETKDYITEKGLEESSTNLIPENSIITSTRMGLGRAFINDVEMSINQDMKAIITTDEVKTEYLLFWIFNISDYIESIGRGTTVKGLSLTALRSIDVPLPPKEEQEKIVESLKEFYAEKKALEEEKEQLQRLKKGLMQDLLTGSVRTGEDVRVLDEVVEVEG
jgi:type I restriction enzyme S subunit